MIAQLQILEVTKSHFFCSAYSWSSKMPSSRSISIVHNSRAVALEGDEIAEFPPDTFSREELGVGDKALHIATAAPAKVSDTLSFFALLWSELNAGISGGSSYLSWRPPQIIRAHSRNFVHSSLLCLSRNSLKTLSTSSSFSFLLVLTFNPWDEAASEISCECSPALP